jgi:hypothetical protein
VDYTDAVSLGVQENSGTFYMELNDHLCAKYDGTSTASDGNWRFVAVAWSSSTATAL